MTHPPQNNENTPIPWHLGIHDAHCHPTDTMTSIAAIPSMKAATLTIMATRGEDQELVLETARNCGERVVPCFGWHPWFSHLIMDDTTSPTPTTSISGFDTSGEEEWELKKAHYKTILTPTPDDNDFIISTLPPPIPLTTHLTQTRSNLHTHPTALVGEIGLDRSFRLPNPWHPSDHSNRDNTLTPGSREGRTLSPFRVKLEHQKAVFRAQLSLAAELGRAVSVHSVQAHGVVFEVFRDVWRGFERKGLTKKERRRRSAVDKDIHEVEDEDTCHSEPTTPGTQGLRSSIQPHTDGLPFPPRICMHSYSGPIEPITQFLHPSNPSDIYFSFSCVINFHGPSAQKAFDAVRAVPDDRILIESDMHTAGEKMDELLAEVVRTVCWLRGWEIEDGVRRLGENWRRFVFG